uniref:Uncharacterized protein n=1 Tax=Oryza rufipogon TaxID=4529 RepID=A0A0E0MR28_ORYRU
MDKPEMTFRDTNDTIGMASPRFVGLTLLGLNGNWAHGFGKEFSEPQSDKYNRWMETIVRLRFKLTWLYGPRPWTLARTAVFVDLTPALGSVETSLDWEAKPFLEGSISNQEHRNKSR